jgi:hypothetical protein
MKYAEFGYAYWIEIFRGLRGREELCKALPIIRWLYLKFIRLPTPTRCLNLSNLPLVAGGARTSSWPPSPPFPPKSSNRKTSSPSTLVSIPILPTNLLVYSPTIGRHGSLRPALTSQPPTQPAEPSPPQPPQHTHPQAIEFKRWYYKLSLKLIIVRSDYKDTLGSLVKIAIYYYAPVVTLSRHRIPSFPRQSRISWTPWHGAVERWKK